MMLNHTCARGVYWAKKEMIKNGAIWCILSVPKYVIINLKIKNFRMINQKPKFCAIFFSKIIPDAHVRLNTKMNTFYRGVGGQ